MLCRRPQSAMRWLIGLTIMCESAWPACVVHAGLYECRDPSGAPIYTDSPAQLEHCQPVASGGASRLGLVGGTPPSSSPAPAGAGTEPTPPFPSPPVFSPGTPDAGSPTITPTGGLAPSSGTPAGVSEEVPCIPGVNPLNPFSSPPCATASHTGPSSPAPVSPVPLQP